MKGYCIRLICGIVVILCVLGYFWINYEKPQTLTADVEEFADQDQEIPIFNAGSVEYVIMEPTEPQIIASWGEDAKGVVIENPQFVWIILDGKEINLAEWMRSVAIFKRFETTDTYGYDLQRTDGKGQGMIFGK